jgi:putative FmdB family regulatory protein
MPIYEFFCNGCHETFEELVLPSDPEVACPACHSVDIQRQISVFSMSSGSSGVSAGGCGCTPKTCGCH